MQGWTLAITGALCAGLIVVLVWAGFDGAAQQRKAKAECDAAGGTYGCARTGHYHWIGKLLVEDYHCACARDGGS
jgi:hypothetical protein